MTPFVTSHNGILFLPSYFHSLKVPTSAPCFSTSLNTFQHHANLLFVGCSSTGSTSPPLLTWCYYSHLGPCASFFLVYSLLSVQWVSLSMILHQIHGGSASHPSVLGQQVSHAPICKTFYVLRNIMLYFILKFVINDQVGLRIIECKTT